ncbi:odorant receptor 2a-like [Musca vetustissima]|uniref:odorant receptor 2a-like n=1 Tax=Musca vetustissima TaxID=27455 RepID=UPI002AB5F3C4|nr:odorant receptor 2a-like [Musca vetustissima]
MMANSIAKSNNNNDNIYFNLDTNVAFRYHWKIWRWTGIKPLKDINPELYKLYAIVLNILVTLLFPLTLIIKVFFSQTLQELCENLTITISDCQSNLKFVNVYFVRHQLDRIKSILRKLDRRVQSNEEFIVLKSAISMAQSSFLIFFRLYSFGTTLSVVKVVLAENRSLLFPAWFGVNWEENLWTYVGVIVYQFFALAVQALQNVANDSYPPAYLVILSAHMRALEIRVKAVGHSVEDDMQEVLTLSGEKQRKCLKEFNECIKDYLNILKLHSIIQRIISKACLAQFACSALVQCTVGLHFMYVMDAANYEAQLMAIIFFVAVTLEAFVICYFGHMMSLQSSNLTYAFYSCGWLAQAPEFKRNLIITLMRTQRTSTILAGSYIPVDLPTFVVLMKYAYSVFTLLIRFK